MTIKMLIVDDEPVICQGLASTLPWSQLDIEVVGTANNGKQALEVIAKEGVDLVLTDVSMPEMDGLDLSEVISAEYPNTRIIMFSGYDEFEYARQAIRLGVEDYLLKPVDIDELISLIKRVKQIIVEQKQGEVHHQKEMLSQQILHYLFNAPLSQDSKDHNGTGITSYRLLISEMSNYYKIKNVYTENEVKEVKESWHQQVSHVLNEHGVGHIAIFGHENELLIVCYSRDNNILNDEYVMDLCRKMDGGCEHTLSFGISAIHQSLSDLAQVHEKTATALAAYRGTYDNIVFSNQGEHKIEVVYPKKEEVSLQKAIIKQNKVAIESTLHDLFEEFIKKGLTLEQVLQLSRELEAILKSKIQEVNRGKLLDQISFILKEDVDLKIYNSFEAIKILLLEDLGYIIDSMEERDRNHWIIENAKEYIQKNYQKEIKALDVAEQNFITPNYFSVLFKQETGQSYSEYLNSLRMEKARELLLNTPNKVFEIAEYVGYKEYKYFVQVFKKYVGLTPTQYRRLNTSEK